MATDKYHGQVVAVTGAAGGIGAAIAQSFVDLGAQVAISDIDSVRAHATAKQIGATAFHCDVANEHSMEEFIEQVQSQLGSIDIFVSNAGVGFDDGPQGFAGGGTNTSWNLSWQINTMANVYAARILVPDWIAGGGGRMVIVASAAGLLAQVGSGSYTTTKHAAVGFAEYLAIMHRADGIRVQCVCPQYVKTNMTAGMNFNEDTAGDILMPADVANALLQAIDEDRFLVLPHSVVGGYFTAKAQDVDQYIAAMSANLHKMQNPLKTQKKSKR